MIIYSTHTFGNGYFFDWLAPFCSFLLCVARVTISLFINQSVRRPIESSNMNEKIVVNVTYEFRFWKFRWSFSVVKFFFYRSIFQYSKKISIYSSNFPFQMTGVCLSNWRKWIIFDLWKLCWKNNPQKLHATSIKNPTAFYHPFNQPKERNEKNHETPSFNLVSIAFATCVENNMYDN